jgi:hypothetical protein
MPEYTMKNKKTGEVKKMILSFSERDEFLKDKNWSQPPSTPLIVSGVKSAMRLSDDGWKENMRRIKKNAGPGNKIEL